jgi:hypothetical protein
METAHHAVIATDDQDLRVADGDFAHDIVAALRDLADVADAQLRAPEDSFPFEREVLG